MKKLLSVLVLTLIVSILSANQILQFGWEDPTKTVLGTDYTTTQTLNTDELAHSGDRSLKVWIDPFDEDNNIACCYVWWITGLADGDSIYASTWVYDDDPGYPKGKIYTDGTSFPNDMYTSYSYTGSGNSSGIGWEQLSKGCIFDSDWGMYDGFAVKLNVYAFFSAVYANDFVTVEWTTASESDVLGFNIFRAIEDDYTLAEKVNADPIQGHGSTTQPSEYSFVDESADPYSI